MASTKKLVLIETDSTNTERGKLFALDPKDATGIALPSIRMVSALPSKGLVKGETVALEPDMSLYTWRGNTWTRLMGEGSSNCPVDLRAAKPRGRMRKCDHAHGHTTCRSAPLRHGTIQIPARSQHADASPSARDHGTLPSRPREPGTGLH